MRMRCQNCQAEIREEFSFCERCGAPLKPGVVSPPSVHVLQPSSRKKDNPTVIAIIVVVVVLAVTFLGPFILYYMVLGFGEEYKRTPTVLIVDEVAVLGGVKLVLSSPTSLLEWGDVTVVLEDETDFATWHGFSTSDLYGPGLTTWNSGQGRLLGEILVWLSITDYTGNGEVNYYDYVIITTEGDNLPPEHTYTLRMIFEPSADQIVSETLG